MRFHPDHLRRIDLQPAQAMVRERVLSENYLAAVQAGPAVTVLDGDRVVACGGVVDGDDGSVLWAFMACDAGGHMTRIVRCGRRLVEVAKRPTFATAAVDFEPGQRLLEMLGFTRDPEPVDSASADGKRHYVYTRNE